MNDLKFIHRKIIAFRNERSWAQFHDPKNLAEEELENIKHEIANIFIFLTKMYDPTQVIELLRKKRDLKSLEQRLYSG